MFEVYPGFEELPVRVEVEWHDRKRPLVARIAQWPLLPSLVFGACRFEDETDDGEWVITDHLGVFIFPFDADGSGVTKEKLISIFERQLHKKLVYLARLIELPLAGAPRFALCAPLQHIRKFEHNRWVKDHIFYESFDFADSPFPCNADGVRTALLKEWNNPHSDARFAWEWAQWSYEEQEQRSMGTTRDKTELSQVAQWMMQCSPELWEDDQQWTWHLSLVLHEANQLSNDEQGFVELPPCLRPWLHLLQAHFAPDRRAEWFDNYQCVRDFWAELITDEVEPEIIQVETRGLTSHHQLIEAKLALRDWLRTAAMPDVAAKLMASLDA